jgi:hypothetical protein
MSTLMFKANFNSSCMLLSVSLILFYFPTYSYLKKYVQLIFFLGDKVCIYIRKIPNLGCPSDDMNQIILREQINKMAKIIQFTAHKLQLPSPTAM